MIHGKTIFVTGGAGFIGSAFIGRVIESNRIIAYDNLSRNALEQRPFLTHSNLTLIPGDVLDFDQLSRTIPAETDIVVHCAAIAGVDTVRERPVETMRVNMIGTANVLQAANRLSHCERVICFSSSEIFGQQAAHAGENEKSVIGSAGEARWTYAVSKLAGEHLAIAYHQAKGLPAAVLRPFNIYGPGQVGEGALRTFVVRALNNEPLEIHGDGTQIRAWCYVDDMIDALMLVIEHPGAVGESFNIGNPLAAVTIYGLASTVVRVLDSQSRIFFTRKAFADVEFRIPAVDKAREILGFEARIDLEQGIRLTADYFRTHRV